MSYDFNFDYRSLFKALQTRDVISLLPILLDYDLLLILNVDEIEDYKLPRIIVRTLNTSTETQKYQVYKLRYLGFYYELRFYEHKTVIKFSNSYQTITAVKRSALTANQCIVNFLKVPSKYNSFLKIFRKVIKSVEQDVPTALIPFPSTGN